MNPLGQKLKEVADRYGLRDVYVFGSRAAEIAARFSDAPEPVAPTASDLDLAVQPMPGHTLGARDRVRVAGAFEDLFSVPRVDLVVLSEASSLLAVELVRGELLYTADPRAQAEQELYVLRRAADLAPFQSERVRRILSSGAR